jgi:hypothetical protein
VQAKKEFKSVLPQKELSTALAAPDLVLKFNEKICKQRTNILNLILPQIVTIS